MAISLHICHLIFTPNCIIGQFLLLSVFTFTFKSKKFISSHLTGYFCHGTQRTRMPPTIGGSHIAHPTMSQKMMHIRKYVADAYELRMQTVELYGTFEFDPCLHFSAANKQ